MNILIFILIIFLLDLVRVYLRAYCSLHVCWYLYICILVTILHVGLRSLNCIYACIVTPLCVGWRIAIASYIVFMLVSYPFCVFVGV